MENYNNNAFDKIINYLKKEKAVTIILLIILLSFVYLSLTENKIDPKMREKFINLNDIKNTYNKTKKRIMNMY